jgi:cyclic beta-1,2-glucan synthetase
MSDAHVPEAVRRRLRATAAAVGQAARSVTRPAVAPSAVTRPANGYGEFVEGADEYRIVLTRRADGSLDLPPMPWCQVLANEHDFGVLLSEKGSMTTFNGNSRLHRLTPWRNDPVEDPHDEAFFVRDEDTGAFASLLPGPAPGADVYEVRHGFGYSTFRHTSLGLAIEATVVVPTDAPVRIVSLSIHNGGDRDRHLSLYQWATLVQGGTPHETRDSIHVSVDATRGCVTAVNPAAGVVAGRVLFTAFSGLTPADASIDRRVVLGCPGSTVAPRALVEGGPLEVGAPGEAMAAQRALVTLPAGATHTCAMLLGEVANLSALDALLARFTPAGVAQTLAATRAAWAERLSATRIHTPVAALDRVVNGWLGYQTIVCRLWARSAYYQSGGAYGFRDQLQDASSLALDAPDMLRAQILRNAGHQFEEGDVLHWWHPPESVGIRTRFADDLVWLPYLTAHYLHTTGDLAILDEVVGFRAGPALAEGEDEHYFKSLPASSAASVYEHCARALRRGMTVGRNGLPLFGCGDWNDGMNRVGREGRGESTWMGFFLVSTIDAFRPYAEARGDTALLATMQAYRAQMVTALNDTGWDGGWYRRGYYDSGAPLGSKDSDECRIDALAQAWAVISGVAPAERVTQALAAMQSELVSYDDRLVRLLAPPFVNTVEDPGYIKGYVAGVRENGGQYTHAALWAAKALLLAGQREAGARVLAMLSPVSHTQTPADVARYQVEPYVIAADVYGVAPHVGRGGWTWYTGSAGWMLRVTLENLLGVTVEGGHSLRVAPLVPDHWPGFTVEHRRPDGTRYRIEVVTHGGAARVHSATLDGAAVALQDGGVLVPLCQDGALHTLHVAMGPAA